MITNKKHPRQDKFAVVIRGIREIREHPLYIFNNEVDT